MRTAGMRWLAGIVLVSLAALAAPGRAVAQAPSQLFVQADTVLGTKNLAKGELAAKACVSWSRFARNEEIVWRIRVFDPKTMAQMDDKALSSVTVQLADDTTLKASYGPHPPKSPTDRFWAASWVVPAKYPTGTLRYKITAVAADGRTGVFVPFNVGPSLLTITAAVRPPAK